MSSCLNTTDNDDKFGAFSWWFNEKKKEHPESKLTKEEVLERLINAIPKTKEFTF